MSGSVEEAGFCCCEKKDLLKFFDEKGRYSDPPGTLRFSSRSVMR